MYLRLNTMRCRVLERKLCFLQRVMGGEAEIRVREATAPPEKLASEYKFIAASY